MFVQELFLEYKFGDYDPALLRKSGATGFIAALARFNPKRASVLKDWTGISLSFDAFEKSTCPLRPEALPRLFQNIDEALSYEPHTIWLDYFRFGGDCAAMTGPDLPSTHEPCQYCSGKDRAAELNKIAQKARARIPEPVKLGYFALPFHAEDIKVLGQDPRLLVQNFDLVSPLLYHRMINEPVEYIYDFTVWLKSITQKPVMPILQVKDMPDDLADTLTPEEMRQAYEAAAKANPAGVAWFSFDGAVEKGKSDALTKIIKAH